MALKITQENGTYMVSGNLNGTTAFEFYNHFEMILTQEGHLELNVEQLSQLDNNGIMALYKLYRKSLVFNQGFIITGEGSEAICVELGFFMAAA